MLLLKKEIKLLVQNISSAKHLQWRRWINSTYELINSKGIDYVKQQWDKYNKLYSLLDELSKLVYDTYSYKTMYSKIIKPKLKLMFEMILLENTRNVYLYLSFIAKLFKHKATVLLLSYEGKFYLLILLLNGKLLLLIPQNYLYLFDFLLMCDVISIDFELFKKPYLIINSIPISLIANISKQFSSAVLQLLLLSIRDFNKTYLGDV